MSVNSKHLATFVLGAVAGVALHKYLKTEEGEQLLEDLKDKAGDLKKDAEEAMDKAPEYFEQLQTKGTESLKNAFPDADKFLKELLGGLKSKKTTIEVDGTSEVEEPKA